MKECIRIDNPRISILLAVYEPRIDWLREQLISLNNQIYPNLKLYVRDDCSPTVPYEAIKDCIKECITNFEYVIQRNDVNLGSNGTFERLTMEADGEYFAYCDQDDVWLSEKIATLKDDIEKENAVLVCSDMCVIDENGRKVADSITEARSRHKHYSGTGLAPMLVFRNWVSGCTMLMRASIAREAIPFCPHMVHDNYLALYCANKGKIYCNPNPLILYRIHGGNQTGRLAGVDTKNDYVRIRVVDVRKRLEWLGKNFDVASEELKSVFESGLEWTKARELYAQKKRKGHIVWKYRKFGLKVTLFEMIFPYLPEKIFLWMVNLARKGRI